MFKAFLSILFLALLTISAPALHASSSSSSAASSGGGTATTTPVVP